MTIRRHTRDAPALLLTSLVLLALASTASAQETTGTVRLRVESQGRPLSGAEIRGGGTGTFTDAQGRATLRLPAGTHTIDVSLIGYAPGSAP
jgi:hypothetical protein